jgi:hypothetical protein
MADVADHEVTVGGAREKTFSFDISAVQNTEVWCQGGGVKNGRGSSDRMAKGTKCRDPAGGGRSSNKGFEGRWALGIEGC